MPNPDDITKADAIAAREAAPTGGAVIICFAECEPCQWGRHYDEPTPHPWAGREDVEHAAAIGQPKPTGNCGCYCARAKS